MCASLKKWQTCLLLHRERSSEMFMACGSKRLCHLLRCAYWTCKQNWSGYWRSQVTTKANIIKSYWTDCKSGLLRDRKYLATFMNGIIYMSEKPLRNSINIAVSLYLTRIMPIAFSSHWHYRLRRLIGCQTRLHKLLLQPCENLLPPVAANLLLD